MLTPSARKIAFILVAVILLIATPQAHSQDTNGGMVYGPERFSRGTGQPVTESRIVDTTGFESPFTMFVQNGQEDGSGRISSAYIWLDGVEILGPSDFSLEVESHKVPVILSEASKLEVKLTSEEQGFITIWIKEERIQVVLENKNAVTKLITPENGGVLAATGSDGTLFSLQIPANALPEAQEITITPIASIPDLPFSGGLLWGVHFKPEGLNLFAGATLTITPTSIPAPQTLISAAYREGGLDLHLYPMLIRGDDLLFPVTHFSGVLVGSGNNADVQDLLNYWRRTEYQHIQEIENILRRLRNAGADLSNLTFAQKVQLWTAFRDWYYAAVLPSMLSAIELGNTQCDNFDPIYAAFRAWAPWSRSIAILGDEIGDFVPGIGSRSLNELNSEWQERRQSAFGNILLECSQECANIESFCEKTPRTRELLRLSKNLSILGMSDEWLDENDATPDEICGGHLLNMAVGIELVPSEASLDIGESVPVIAYVRTWGGDIVPPLEEANDISWSLSDNSIVDMEVSGETPPQSATVEGKKEGSTEVIAALRECGQEEPFEGRAKITVGPASPVDVAFVVYNGAHNFYTFPPYGWGLYSDHTSEWYDTFASLFKDGFDLSLVNYNKEICTDITSCGYSSQPCSLARTVLPFDSEASPGSNLKLKWQSAWESLETVCDSDPWDLGSSLYSALLHTINNSQWNEEAAAKAIFVFPAASTCYFLYGGACDSESGTGRTLNDVVTAANEKGVNLYVINVFAASPHDPYSSLDGCDGYSCTNNYLYCYQWVAAKEEYQALAQGTNGEYYAAWCDYPDYNEAVKQAISDLYQRVHSAK